MRTSLALSAAAILATLSSPGLGAQAAPAQPAAAPGAHVMVGTHNIKWGPAPPSLPAGAQAAILDGDPGKPGLYIIRLKFPAGYKVPPHWHPTDEHVTLLAGSAMMGMGDKADEASMHKWDAGTYAKMPARASHYVTATTETIVQVTGMGPFEVTYVDPMNDPRKK
ncbi:MAG TPA: cupin domain-containing protein [Vicinamibacterales bacterium]|nr:cupin domain-containing protein [Vicinamibacterales bacterium]